MKLLTRDRFDDLLRLLQQDGYLTLGPTVRDGAVVHRQVREPVAEHAIAVPRCDALADLGSEFDVWIHPRVSDVGGADLLGVEFRTLEAEDQLQQLPLGDA